MRPEWRYARLVRPEMVVCAARASGMDAVCTIIVHGCHVRGRTNRTSLHVRVNEVAFFCRQAVFFCRDARLVRPALVFCTVRASGIGRGLYDHRAWMSCSRTHEPYVPTGTMSWSWMSAIVETVNAELNSNIIQI